MQQQVGVYQVRVVSPGDVIQERDIAFKAVARVNKLLKAMGKSVFLESFDQQYARPGLGRPNEVVGKQLDVENADIVIGLFWYRFGSPPGGAYQSGTEEELARAFQARAQNPLERPEILLYRKTDPLPANLKDEDYLQYGRLLEYFHQCGPQGEHPAYIATFTGDELGEILSDHLLKVLSEFESSESNPDPGRRSHLIPFRTAGKTQNASMGQIPGPIQNRWALVVGVNRYLNPGFTNLKFCVNDARALQKSLEAYGYTVVALHDEATDQHRLPARENIEEDLASILQTAQQDDLVWVHFACHGKLIDGQPYLAVRNSGFNTLRKSGIELAGIVEQMRTSGVRRLVLTLDACHTGIDVGRDLSDPEFIHNAYELAEGVGMLSASTSQQAAQERHALQHGLFTYFLLEGLENEQLRGSKGFITFHDLALYTIDRLRKYRVQSGGAIQEPNYRLDGIGDMILVDYRQE